MTKNDLLKHCRYYKGEETPPEEIKATFWNYEKKWIELLMEDDISVDEMVVIYVNRGLGKFAQEDDTPLTLKALLFNRYLHWNTQCSTEDFKQWYEKEYLKTKVAL